VDRVFVDTSVFLTAMGTPGPATPACRLLLRAANEGRASLHTAAECVQEVAFHRMRMTERSTALGQVIAVRDLCLVHAMDDTVIDTALTLLATTPARGRDAFIAATALLAGFDTIVTTDTRFVEVPGLRRVDPRDLAA
jgi:predicted nucleic acid-binding protein